MSRLDPGMASGTTAGYALKPRCTCRHHAEVHTPRPSNPKVRGVCTAADPEKCPCKTYEPAAVAGTTPRRESQ